MGSYSSPGELWAHSISTTSKELHIWAIVELSLMALKINRSLELEKFSLAVYCYIPERYFLESLFFFKGCNKRILNLTDRVQSLIRFHASPPSSYLMDIEVLLF